MTTAKTQLFEKDLQESADFFKSLAHPARLAILKYLAQTKVCITGDITEAIPLSRTTVGQHLSELKRLNLITGEIEGSKVNYCLNHKILNDFVKNSITLLEVISSAQEEGCC